ncbi:hypothetical protein MMC12_001697 [Toensbergia leucococca]|nr:hypothetical protein [Toensbergia leucococca]
MADANTPRATRASSRARSATASDAVSVANGRSRRAATPRRSAATRLAEAPADLVVSRGPNTAYGAQGGVTPAGTSERDPSHATTFGTEEVAGHSVGLDEVGLPTSPLFEVELARSTRDDPTGCDPSETSISSSVIAIVRSHALWATLCVLSIAFLMWGPMWAEETNKFFKSLEERRIVGANQAQIKSLLYEVDTLRSQVSANFTRLSSEFNQRIDESHTYQVDSFQQKFDSLQQNVDSKLTPVNQRLDGLEKLYDRLRPEQSRYTVDQVDYFAKGLGTVVEPRLTSPTLVREYSWKARLFAKGWGIALPNSPSATSILDKWDGIGDCWCAPPSRGKLQVTLTLGRQVVPTELVVEHISKRSTLDIGAAPRVIELWAHIANKTKRALVDSKMHSHFLRYDRWEIEEEPGDRKLRDRKQPLVPDFTLIGRWEYDILNRQPVQYFRVPLDLAFYGIDTRRVAIRVNSNWGGGNYTCLYRVRLYGEELGAEEFVPDNSTPPWSELSQLDHTYDRT